MPNQNRFKHSKAFPTGSYQTPPLPPNRPQLKNPKIFFRNMIYNIFKGSLSEIEEINTAWDMMTLTLAPRVK